jgi:hypothetical protein
LLSEKDFEAKLSNSSEQRLKYSRKMTAGTGTTGQMRHEMDENKKQKKQSKDLMSAAAATRCIKKARLNRKWLLWKPPEVASKTGASRVRYEVYCKTRTIAEFDQLCPRSDQARKSDLNNDLRKGWVQTIPNPEATSDENESEEEDCNDFSANKQGGGDYENINSAGSIFVREERHHV